MFGAGSGYPAVSGQKELSLVGSNLPLSLKSALPRANDAEISIQPREPPCRPTYSILPLNSTHPPCPKPTISHPNLLQRCFTINLFTQQTVRPHPQLSPLTLYPFSLKKKIYIYIYIYIFGCAGPQLGQVGSWDGTWAPCFGSMKS